MKAVFDKEHIVPGKKGIIVLSHGPMATATVESTAMLLGEQENVAAFGLEPSDKTEDYVNHFMEAYEAFGENAVVFVDLFGGTPSNQLILSALKRRKAILAIGGVSLPMVIEACSLRDELDGENLLDEIVKAGKDAVVNISAEINKSLKGGSCNG